MDVREGVDFFDCVVPFKELPLGTVLFLAKSRETRMIPDLYTPVHLVGFKTSILGKILLEVRIEGDIEVVWSSMISFNLPQ